MKFFSPLYYLLALSDGGIVQIMARQHWTIQVLKIAASQLKRKKNTEGDNGNNQSEISMIDFFLPDGSKAHYLGEGNEFAELDIEVAHPYEKYVIVA